MNTLTDYDRINKRKARRLYGEGKTIYLLPCNVSVYSFWMRPGRINKGIMNNRDFDAIINEFEFYNCNYELGRYTAFYYQD